MADESTSVKDDIRSVLLSTRINKTRQTNSLISGEVKLFTDRINPLIDSLESRIAELEQQLANGGEEEEAKPKLPWYGIRNTGPILRAEKKADILTQWAEELEHPINQWSVNTFPDETGKRAFYVYTAITVKHGVQFLTVSHVDKLAYIPEESKQALKKAEEEAEVEEVEEGKAEGEDIE